MLKAIFFDAAGTIIHLPRPVGEHYREVATRFGVELDATQLDDAFRAAWAAMPARAADHVPRADDDKGWWRDLVYRVLRDVLPTRRAGSFDLAGYFEAVYAHFEEPGVWAAYPEVTEVLGILRARGLRLGVISNFDRRLYKILEGLGLLPLFERVVISSEVGADKPDPFIFQGALDVMQVAAAEAIHVGDDPKRDGGAELVGLRVFRVERPGVTLRDLLAVVDRGVAP